MTAGWLSAILRPLGRVLQLLLGVGLLIGYPAYAIWQAEWIGLLPWAVFWLIAVGMVAGPLPSMRGF